MHRQYHNVTAKYNGYFNARTKFEETVQELELQNKDDFSKILPVFNHGDKQAAKGKSQIFDEVIKKCSAVVTNHEVSNWVDDSFFLIGKAYFFKGEYFEAIETFQYVFNKYKNEEVAKESLVWLVKAYLETDQLSNARAAIDRGLTDKRFPENLKASLQAAAAAYFIKDKRYEQAMESLDKAVKTEARRSSRRRMHFVLGQLNQRYGSGRKAISSYDQVLSMNPSYEMHFDAKLNIARCAEAGNANTASIRQELVRMARDDKNRSNLDILYYEIGQLDVKMKQLPLAEENFKKAALNASQNPGNKGLAFLALSKIYFNTRRYKDADTYYDSTLAFLSKEHPDYEETGNRKKFLADLVRQIDIITLEDSLQRLARMPDKQLNRLIDRVISDERVAKDKERFLKEQPQNSIPAPQDMGRPGGPGLPPGPGGGGISLPGQSGKALFYFYNQANLSSGFTEFLTRWGNRELTDNWRRSKREQALAGTTNSEPPIDTSLIPDIDESGKKLSREEKEARMLKQRILAKIPKSESQKAASDERITDAMYQLGLLYKDKLKEEDETIAQWEGLLQRFPKAKKKPETAYGLWQVFSKNGNNAKAAFYKKMIEEDFKDSPYDKLIKNPDKPIALTGPIGKAEKELYENAYLAYTRKNYPEAFAFAEKARKEFSGSKLIPKFDLIRAVSLGKVKDSTAMRQALELIIAQYPKDPVKTSAEEMLKVLKGEGFKPGIKGEVKDSSQTVGSAGFVKPPPSGNTLLDSLREVAYSMFKTDAPKSYYFVIWIQDSEARKASPDVKVADFNSRIFSLQTFDVEPTLYDAATQMIIVKQFTQKDKAMDYYSAFIADKVATTAYAPGSWQAVLISPENLLTLRKKMGKPPYLQYFKDQFQFKKN